MFNDFYEIDMNSPADSARYMITDYFWHAKFKTMFINPSTQDLERTDLISSFVDTNYNRLFVNYLEKLDSSCKYVAVGSCFKITRRGTIHFSSFLLKVESKYYVSIEKPCIYI